MYSSTVYALAIQTDGHILLGGEFGGVNGVTRTRLARLNPDGSLDTAFAPVLNGTVDSILLQPDGRILVGGEFNAGLTRLNPDGALDLTFHPGSGAASSGDVFCLALQPDGGLLVGGDFSQFNGIPRGRVVRLNNDRGASLQAPADIIIQPPSYVTAWTGSNTLFGVYAAGMPPLSFQWQLNGTNLPGQTSGVCQLANLSAADAGLYTLIVSNAFGSATSAPVRLALLPASARPGSVDLHLQTGTGPDAPIWSIVEQPDGKLLIGGNFANFNGVPHQGIVRLNPDGNFDPDFNPAAGVYPYEQVYTILPQPDGKILVGGYFSHFNGELCTNLARLNADGSLDTNFSASVDGWAWPMALQPDGKIVVGGYFGYADGVPRNNITRFNADGSLDPSFDPGDGADNFSAALLLQPDGKILVGGVFGWFAGVFGGMARLNPNGSVDTTFTNCIGLGAEDWFGAINAFARQPDGKILVAGCFDDFNHTTRTNLVRLNPDGSLDTTFVPAPLAWQTTVGQIYGLALQSDGKIVFGFWPSNIVAGAGDVPGGGPCVARLNPDGSLDASYQIGACSAGGIWCMDLLRNGQIMIGGDFTDFNGAATPRLARLRGDEAIVVPPFSLGARWNGGLLELGLFGEAGRSYTIEVSSNLPQFSTWTNILCTGTNWLPVPVEPQQFFRARTSP